MAIKNVTPQVASIMAGAKLMQSCEDENVTYLCVQDKRFIFRDGVCIGWYTP